MTGLEELDARGNRAITESSALAIIQGCRSLRRLDMRGCYIGEHMVAKLKAVVSHSGTPNLAQQLV